RLCRAFDRRSRQRHHRNRSNRAGGAMSRVADLKVKIFADGADYEGIVKMSKNPVIKGFTTNPTLMRKAGVSDYEAFARKVLAASHDRPVSFEVFADDFASMAEQARTIAAWGPNVNVKIPVTNTKGQSASELIRALSSEGVALNVTAIFTLDQVRTVVEALHPATAAIVSVFAGRIADTGVDPIPHMQACKQITASRPKAELLWASTRELLNIFHAEQSGCDIVTVPNEFLSKLDLVGKDLAEYSRETVQSFYRDAAAAAYEIKTTRFAAEGRRGASWSDYERRYWQPAAQAIAGRDSCRNCSRAATESRSLTSCSSATSSCRGIIPTCASSTAISATPRNSRRPWRVMTPSSIWPASRMTRASSSTRIFRPRSISTRSNHWLKSPKRQALSAWSMPPPAPFMVFPTSLTSPRTIRSFRSRSTTNTKACANRC